MDEVDLAAAAARGVMVTRAPGSNTAAVAEHTLAMMLALVKDLQPFAATVAAGGWRGGTGAVPRRGRAAARAGRLRRDRPAVARLAGAFGMTVAAFDPACRRTAAPASSRAARCLRAGAGSDILSVHCPLTPATTRGWSTRAVLAAMPAGGFVVNTARGGIVDEAALLAALDGGHLAGAALDVFADGAAAARPSAAQPPARARHAACRRGHAAARWSTMGVMAAECIAAALTGGTVPPERIVAHAEMHAGRVPSAC